MQDDQQHPGHPAQERIVLVGDIAIANHLPFALIAGPCQIESRAHALEVAAALRELSAATGVPVIYKSSYDKANRTSATAARGIGMAEGLAILAEVRARTGLPTLTDVHAPATQTARRRTKIGLGVHGAVPGKPRREWGLRQEQGLRQNLPGFPKGRATMK